MLQSIKEQPVLFFSMLVITAFVMLLPELAHARSGTGLGNPIGGTLCAVVKWFTGTVGKGIATLAIIVIGIGALMGKVSWGMAIIVGLGVAVVFGAGTIVDLLDQKGTAGSAGSGCDDLGEIS